MGKGGLFVNLVLNARFQWVNVAILLIWS